MINKFIGIGRLCADPELRYTKNSTPVCSFTLAVERNFKNSDGEKDADFINIVVWRQQAEYCSNYLHKGDMCGVEGSLQIKSYQAKDGTNKKAAEIVADNVQFLTPPKQKPLPKTEEDKPFTDDDVLEEEGLMQDGLPF